MAQCLRVPAALQEKLDSVPSIHIGWLTVDCSTSFGGTQHPLASMGTCMHVLHINSSPSHTHIKKINKNNPQNYPYKLNSSKLLYSFKLPKDFCFCFYFSRSTNWYLNICYLSPMMRTLSLYRITGQWVPKGSWKVPPARSLCGWLCLV